MSSELVEVTFIDWFVFLTWFSFIGFISNAWLSCSDQPCRTDAHSGVCERDTATLNEWLHSSRLCLIPNEVTCNDGLKFFKRNISIKVITLLSLWEEDMWKNFHQVRELSAFHLCLPRKHYISTLLKPQHVLLKVNSFILFISKSVKCLIPVLNGIEENKNFAFLSWRKRRTKEKCICKVCRCQWEKHI